MMELKEILAKAKEVVKDSKWIINPTKEHLKTLIRNDRVRIKLNIDILECYIYKSQTYDAIVSSNGDSCIRFLLMNDMTLSLEADKIAGLRVIWKAGNKINNPFTCYDLAQYIIEDLDL